MDGSIPIVARITHLYVSEQTKAMSETSKAEVVIDYFLKESGENYYFITKSYSTAVEGGMDVTHLHPKNICNAIIKGLEKLSNRSWKDLVNRSEAFNRDQLLSGMEGSVDIAAIPVFKATYFKEGVFATFEEFLNNKPSVTSNFEVKTGSNVKLWFTSDGKRSRVKEDVFGFASDNQFYVLFYKDFYPVEKKEDGFYFIGPRIPDQSAVTAGALFGGAIGGAIAASTSGERYEYKIDLSSGGIRIIRAMD